MPIFIFIAILIFIWIVYKTIGKALIKYLGNQIDLDVEDNKSDSLNFKLEALKNKRAELEEAKSSIEIVKELTRIQKEIYELEVTLAEIKKG